MRLRSLNSRAPLLVMVVAWAAGSAVAHAGLAPRPVLLVVTSFVGLVLAWGAMLRDGSRSRPTLASVLGGMAIALAAAGALRTIQERARPADWDALALPPREARLELRIERLFASREPGRVSGLARVVGTPGHLPELADQRIHFSATWTGAASAPLRGAGFSALGVLEAIPFASGPGTFRRFLADEGVNFSFTRARLDGPVRPAGAWARFRGAAEQRLERVLRAGLANNPRLGDLYVAMLLGQKQALSLEQKDWFIRSGTMHLFAISGLHIAAIALAVNTTLALARLPQRARFLAGTALLWFYVEITGGDASAVRAFWMITCLLGARQLRTPSNSLSALAASALGVLVASPHQLFTAGFQMSYGIVAALLLYGVPLQEKWQASWQPWVNLPREAWGWRHVCADSLGRALLGAVALGLAATLVSTPATLGFFGLFAPGGFLVNLVLIPAASLVLFSGVAALFVGLAGLTPLAILFNHAAALVLAAMEGTVTLALRMPGVSWPASFDPPWLASAAGAVLLALLAVGYALRWSRRVGGYWTPYAVLGILLLFGVTTPPPGDAPFAREKTRRSHDGLNKSADTPRATASRRLAQAAAAGPEGAAAPVSAAFSTTWSTMP